MMAVADPLASLTLDSWVTSDHHFEHPNIRKYQDRPEDHMRIMRQRWKETVGHLDVVLHLGDLVCFGDRQRHPFWINGLPGRKLLLRGNHDKHSDQWYEAGGFTVLGRKPILWWDAEGERVVSFSHEPAEDDGSWQVNVHGHIHKNPHHPEFGRLADRRNVCVEVTDYRPIRLREALAKQPG